MAMQGQEESASHMWSRCQGWEDGSKVVSSHEYRNSQGIIKLLGPDLVIFFSELLLFSYSDFGVGWGAWWHIPVVPAPQKVA